MRLSYILDNTEGRGRCVPKGQAWQWVHHVEDLAQLNAILSWTERRVAMNRLNLLNVYLDHVEITAPKYADIPFSAKPHIIYSRVTQPDRVIDMSSVACSLEKMAHPFA